jgi:galactokinase
MLDDLKGEFAARFGLNDSPLFSYFAPGRVILIGEHTDYNGGLVLPCALDMGTTLLIRFNQSHRIRFASTNFHFSATIDRTDLTKKQNHEWINYPIGVMNQFLDKLIPLAGMDLLYSGNIPYGAGLSSSASIEMVTAFALNDLYGTGWTMIDLIEASKKAENEFVGVNCGIMDQFIVGMGQHNHALFLNCDSLDFELVPFDLKSHLLIITNTNKKRGLADSKYNERVEECKKSLQYLNTILSLNNLGELNLETFSKYETLIPDATLRKRARHVVSENQRVVEAKKALKMNDLDYFGKLMYASHDSLRFEYEVTGNELDVLVDESKCIEGVLGSRMTGAGFGGCTVTLIMKDKIKHFISEVSKAYIRKTGLIPEFYPVQIGNGVRSID